MAKLTDLRLHLRQNLVSDCRLEYGEQNDHCQVVQFGQPDPGTARQVSSLDRLEPLIPAEPDADGMPPLPIPGADDPTWLSRAIDASASALDRRLVLIGSLGSDRPENPLLLQQTGALWLGEDEVDGTAVTVFAAPPSDEVAEPGSVDADTSPLRLWVTADALLLRAQTRVDGAWQDVDFGTAAGPDLEAPADE